MTNWSHRNSHSKTILQKGTPEILSKAAKNEKVLIQPKGQHNVIGITVLRTGALLISKAYFQDILP